MKSEVDDLETKIRELEEKIAEKKEAKEPTDTLEFQLNKAKKKRDNVKEQEEEVLKSLEVCEICGNEIIPWYCFIE